MIVTLRIRGVPVPFVAKFFNNRYRPSWATATTGLRADYDTETGKILAVWPERADLREYWGVFWNTINTTMVYIPLKSFREKIDEKSDERSAFKFTLSEWGCQRGVSRLRRGLQEREEPSSDERQSQREMDLSQSELHRAGEGDAIAATAIFERELFNSDLFGEMPSRARPAPTATARRQVSEETRIRSEWARMRQGMEAEGLLQRNRSA